MSQMVNLRVPFVTNRAAFNGVFGPPPTPTEFMALAFGSGVVTASPEPYYPGRAAPGQSFYNPASVDPGTAADADPYLVAFLCQWLRGAAAAGQVPLLYFHGFEYTFEEALVGTGDLGACFAADPAGTKLAPLVFGFPTHDDPFAYVRDRSAAESSGPSAARLLRALNVAWRDSVRPKMMLLAHSMGNHVLECACAALQGVALEGPMFAQAMLMAADVTRDTIGDRQRLGQVSTLARWVSAGVNLNDPITDLVANLVDPFPRLACCGPAPGCLLPSNTRVVDYTHVISAVPVPPRTIRWDYVGHCYYHTVPAVRADLAYLLADMPPDAVPGRLRWTGGDQDGWLRVVPPATVSAAEVLYGAVRSP